MLVRPWNGVTRHRAHGLGFEILATSRGDFWGFRQWWIEAASISALRRSGSPMVNGQRPRIHLDQVPTDNSVGAIPRLAPRDQPTRPLPCRRNYAQAFALAVGPHHRHLPLGRTPAVTHAIHAPTGCSGSGNLRRLFPVTARDLRILPVEPFDHFRPCRSYKSAATSNDFMITSKAQCLRLYLVYTEPERKQGDSHDQKRGLGFRIASVSRTFCATMMMKRNAAPRRFAGAGSACVRCPVCGYDGSWEITTRQLF